MRFSAILFPLVLALVPATAFAVPANLMNKTITVSMTTTAPWVANGRTGTGSRRTFMTIYISSAGRIFSRKVRYDRNASQTMEGEPGVNTWRFVGDKLVGTSLYVSGAGQTTIDFDSSGQTCTASVKFGRDAGRPMTWKGVNGVTFTATGPWVVSNVTCSVASGNAFAGQ